MPAIAVIALLALLAPAMAAGPLAPTLDGPTLVAAARGWGYGGRIPAPLLAQNVTLHLDGTQVDWDLTDARGIYATHAIIPRGDHVLVSKWLGGESAPLLVHGYPTWPAEVGQPRVTPGFYYWQTNVSWNYPWTDGGYPVTSYTIERSTNNGSYVMDLSANVTSYTHTHVPGDSFRYRATVTTSYGTSNATGWTAATNRTLATIEIVDFRLCDAANCTDVPLNGNFTTTSGANVSVRVRVRGVTDDHPVGGPAHANVMALGAVLLPGNARAFDTVTNATGEYALDLGGAWAIAPSSGCRWIPVTGHARTPIVGRWEDTASFELCVA